jgi:signal transduction histidine kinase
MWWMFAYPWWQMMQVQTNASETSAADAPAASATSSLVPYYQYLATHGDHAFGVWDRGTGFSLFSANWERVTGLSVAYCAGHGFLGQLAARDAELIGSTLQSLPTRLDSPIMLEGCARDNAQEDSERMLAFALWPMSSEGLHGSIMVMAKDIDAHRRLQREYQEMCMHKHTAEKGRSSFLSNMSHELRTPLNAIMGFSEMMKNQTFGEVGHPTYEEYVKDIHGSGQHLLGKINDLLDIASIDQNQISLDEEDVSINALLQDVIESCSHQAFERNIRIHCDIPKDSIIAVMDRRKVMCILSHFLSNALRHSASGTTITVNCRGHRTQGLILSVRDQGEGITSARLANIVAALQSPETYFAMDSEGIGLGLSLAKELAVRHDGTVSIDSIRGTGTVVSLVLPPERIIRGLGTGNSRRGIHLAKR